MFAYLRGKLAEKSPSSVIIDCNGVGYELRIPLSTFENLPSENEEVKLFTYVYFNSEDGTRLFGFMSSHEKELFRMLINLNRIGPRIALSVLSTLSVIDFISCIQTNNFKLLATAPGLGVKSAQKMIIELKDKVGEIDTAGISSAQLEEMNEDRFKEAESALLTLGFKVYEITRALRDLKFNKTASTQEIIKQSIKYLYQKRNES
ncbi:MAG TPA: Holliday junction branch migration protein RuvA [Candidatus Cloacimonadota bacterium]|nr:Holliday junction branch migration protein RuvA [Candidatus Cloacimonadota bacterium]